MTAARRCAWTALVVGLAYAVVSAYWGAGGTWLLNTVGGEIERQAQRGDTAVSVALWAAVALKILAALIPVELCRVRSASVRTASGARRWLRRAAWVECVVLLAYGGVLTAVGLLVQAGVLSASEHADRRALAWHAYLWDPWFLIWGLLVLVVMRRARAYAG